MRRLLCLLVTAMTAAITVMSQNVQLHYDMGHTLYSDLTSRPNVTSTVEMFKPDRWGSTFLFADIDYYTDGAAGAYWEIARELNVSRNRRWALHLEYNGGAATVEHTSIASRIQHAALIGGAWNWGNADFSKTFSLQALYKRYFHGQHRDAYNSFQLTAVWGANFAHGLVSFSGYCDMWHDPDVNGKLILQSEPQLWINLWHLPAVSDDLHLSVGTELEVSNNFVFNDEGQRNRFYAIPTLGVKWTF